MIRLLDLCCKAGGAARGYELAALELGIEIEITGIDIEPQPNYPYKFIQSDAIEYFSKHLYEYTHVHASPPCQAYTMATSETRKNGKVYPDIIIPIRDLMELSGLPSVIENVPQAPIRPDIILRGDLFGLKVLRKRHFECINWFSLSPKLYKKKGSVRNGDYVSVFGKEGLKGQHNNPFPCKFRKKTVLKTWKFAMDIDWMNGKELAEAIPPAYTHYIGIDFFKQEKKQ